MQSVMKDKKNSGKTGRKRRICKYIPVYLMAAPGLIYLLINNYIPMFGLVVAFKNYNFNLGILGSKWAGLKNFEFLFRNTDSGIITRNTLLYNLVFIVLDTLVAIIVAIFLNEVRHKKLKKGYQTIILLPALISMVIVSYLVYAFLDSGNGLLNHLLNGLGIKSVDWYATAKYWPLILVLVHTWSSAGFTCIIYFSSLVGIDVSYYEAASVDGASTLEKIRHITLPLLKPTVIVMSLLAVGKIFYSDFGLFYQVPMNSGLLMDATSTIDTYIYRALIQSPNIGMSGAAAFYQSVMGFLLVLGANWLVGRYEKESALF